MPGARAVKHVEITPAGWVVEERELFSLIADHQPPQPYGLWEQFCVDARNWKPVAIWVGGIGLIVVGAVYGVWALIPAGVVPLGMCLFMFQGTVRYVRDCPSHIGVIGSIKPHPLMRNCSTAKACLPDGRKVPVALSTRLVRDILDEGKCAEILFLHDPRTEYSLVYGARSMPGRAKTESPAE
jgi:hypothetical protein